MTKRSELNSIHTEDLQKRGGLQLDEEELNVEQEQDPNTVKGFMNLIVRARSDNQAIINSACELWLQNKGYPVNAPDEKAYSRIGAELLKAFSQKPYSVHIVTARLKYSFNSMLERMEDPTPERRLSAIIFFKAMAQRFRVEYFPDQKD